MKRVLYLLTVALVAMLILVPAAMAQEMEQTVMRETTTIVEGDLPKSGGLPVGTILAPAAALLIGGGLVAYAAARRR
jgi:hypothetical protein